MSGDFRGWRHGLLIFAVLVAVAYLLLGLAVRGVNRLLDASAGAA